MTQFGRALSELNIEILCASSSQAKGRVERANRTLQDRLVKELRLAGVSNMSAGNAFLPGFMERYNERFVVPPARTQDLHRPLRTATPRLNDILCHREQRYVGAQLTFHYDRKQIILEQTDVAKGLEGQYVELFDYWSKPLEVRWRGHVLPYRVFSKDQGVSHTAILREQASGSSPCGRQGPAGLEAHHQGHDQQREDWLQEAQQERRHSLLRIRCGLVTSEATMNAHCESIWKLCLGVVVLIVFMGIGVGHMLFPDCFIERSGLRRGGETLTDWNQTGV